MSSFCSFWSTAKRSVFGGGGDACCLGSKRSWGFIHPTRTYRCSACGIENRAINNLTGVKCVQTLGKGGQRKPCDGKFELDDDEAGEVGP